MSRNTSSSTEQATQESRETTIDGGESLEAAIQLLDQALEQHPQQLLNAAPDAMFIVDRRGSILLVNQQAEQLFGYTRAELRGQPIEVLVPERFRAKHVDQRHQFTQTPNVRPMGSGLDLCAVDKVGNEFPVDIGISPLQAGPERFTLCSVRDITERRNASRELEERLRFEHLLADISARFVGLRAGDIDREIEPALGQVAEFLGVQRAVLGQLDAAGIQLTHCWAAPGRDRYPDGLVLDVSAMKWFWNRLQREDVLRFACPEEIPAVAERAFCDQWGVQSNLAVPLSVAGECFGLIAWETLSEQRHWSSETVHRAKLIVDVFANALQRRQADQTLHQSEIRFRRLAEAIDQVFWFVELAPLRVLYVSPAYERIWGGSAEELYCDPGAWINAVHQEDRERVRRRFADWTSGRRDNYVVEYRVVNRSGQTCWILDRGAAIHDGSSPSRWVSGIAEDITMRKAAEEKLKMMGGRLLNAQEEERRRIARELHDDINQQLALLAVDLDMLAQSVSEPDDDTQRKIEELAAKARVVSSNVHGLSHRLHPSKLDRLGISTTVRSLCKELSKQHKIRIRWSHDDVPRTLPSGYALNLYRIVQEALNNVIKHSGTTSAEVHLAMVDNAVVLSISDSGRGFDPPSAAMAGGLGLVSIDERVRFIGGQLTIDSCPGHGCEILVKFALPADSC